MFLQSASCALALNSYAVAADNRSWLSLSLSHTHTPLHVHCTCLPTAMPAATLFLIMQFYIIGLCTCLVVFEKLKISESWDLPSNLGSIYNSKICSLLLKGSIMCIIVQISSKEVLHKKVPQSKILLEFNLDLFRPITLILILFFISVKTFPDQVSL